jgi:hypothetical protein
VANDLFEQTAASGEESSRCRGLDAGGAPLKPHREVIVPLALGLEATGRSFRWLRLRARDVTTYLQAGSEEAMPAVVRRSTVR